MCGDRLVPPYGHRKGWRLRAGQLVASGRPYQGLTWEVLPKRAEPDHAGTPPLGGGHVEYPSTCLLYPLEREAPYGGHRGHLGGVRALVIVSGTFLVLLNLLSDLWRGSYQAEPQSPVARPRLGSDAPPMRFYKPNTCAFPT